MKLIAVYGTLKNGFYNHRIMGGSKLLGPFQTESQFTMFDNGGFPFVFPGGNTSIFVEVYDIVSSQTLNHIYGLEGYTGQRNNPRNWYDTIDVNTPWGIAEMFIAKKRPNLPIVESGNWQ